MLKKIFSNLFLAVFFVMIASAQTQPVNTTGLSAEQVVALNSLAEQLRKQPENTLANLSLQTATPDKVKEWTEAGEAAGKAVAAFTKEIGIAADQFLKTDVGRTAFYVAIWKFGGDKVIGSLVQITFNVVLGVGLLLIWWRFTRRFAFCERMVGTVIYNENTFLRWMGFNKKEVRWEKDDAWITRIDDGDYEFWAHLCVKILSGVLFLTIVWMCWPKVAW